MGLLKKALDFGKKIIDGVKNAAKKVIDYVKDNPVLKSIAIAAAVYLTAGAALGAIGTIGTTTSTWAGTMNGISTAWTSLGTAASSAMGGEFAAAGNTLAGGMQSAYGYGAATEAASTAANIAALDSAATAGQYASAENIVQATPASQIMGTTPGAGVTDTAVGSIGQAGTSPTTNILGGLSTGDPTAYAAPSQTGEIFGASANPFASTAPTAPSLPGAAPAAATGAVTPATSATALEEYFGSMTPDQLQEAIASRTLPSGAPMTASQLKAAQAALTGVPNSGPSGLLAKAWNGLGPYGKAASVMMVGQAGMGYAQAKAQEEAEKDYLNRYNRNVGSLVDFRRYYS